MSKKSSHAQRKLRQDRRANQLRRDIARAKAATGLSCTEIADLIGAPQSTVSGWSRAFSAPSDANRYKEVRELIAEVTGLGETLKRPVNIRPSSRAPEPPRHNFPPLPEKPGQAFFVDHVPQDQPPRWIPWAAGAALLGTALAAAAALGAIVL